MLLLFTFVLTGPRLLHGWGLEGDTEYQQGISPPSPGAHDPTHWPAQVPPHRWPKLGQGQDQHFPAWCWLIHRWWVREAECKERLLCQLWVQHLCTQQLATPKKTFIFVNCGLMPVSPDLQLVYALRKPIICKNNTYWVLFGEFCLGKGTNACRQALRSADQMDNHIHKSQQLEMKKTGTKTWQLYMCTFINWHIINWR